MARSGQSCQRRSPPLAAAEERHNPRAEELTGCQLHTVSTDYFPSRIPHLPPPHSLRPQLSLKIPPFNNCEHLNDLPKVKRQAEGEQEQFSFNHQPWLQRNPRRPQRCSALLQLHSLSARKRLGAATTFLRCGLDTGCLGRVPLRWVPSWLTALGQESKLQPSSSTRLGAVSRRKQTHKPELTEPPSL